MSASLLSISQPATAQDRCSTVRYEQMRKERRLLRETPEQFEQWMQHSLARRSASGDAIMSTITIPVVVHIIHNGTSDPTNISNAQIISQIDVLNKDFKRLNTDAGSTPPEFTGVAGSMDIQFVLAKRDPEGLPTSGITRTHATKPEWQLSDQSEFKGLSYWPAEDYLNIWVINFATSDIGFAQFPESGTLAGLEDASEDRLTDGIVVHYETFGTIDAGPFDLLARFNKGRTATHEVGHFFGLRHIWGDGSSCNTDYVSDTPPQSGSTSFCPTHPSLSCGGNKMFMNYMDYTDDGCMNIYTAGQVARMMVVLSESPRRLSLTTSLGAIDPPVTSNDLGIRRIINPSATTCTSIEAPVIEVRNYGTNTITSGQIQLSVNASVVETKSFSMSLAPGQLTSLSFDPIPYSPGLSQQVGFEITQTNGGTDGNSQNNTETVQVVPPLTTTLPISEPFPSTPSNWTILNPDGHTTWSNKLAPDNNASNRAMSIEFYQYDNEGVVDWIITPAFAVVTPATSQVRFDIAYAQFPGRAGDALRVYALPACNRDLSQAILLYDKSGTALSTSTASSSPFTPAGAAQWRKSEVLSLSGLTGVTNWQLAFVGKNGYGNNLYLDNVVITEDEVTDIALTGIASPGIVHCNANPKVKFFASNFGTSPVNQFTMSYTLNGGGVQTQTFLNTNIDVGQQKEFELNAVSLNDGENQITLTISNPNGLPDISSNNDLSLTSVLDKSYDKAPLRMTFDNPLEVPWIVASQEGAQDWEPVMTTKEQSITYRGFTNTQLGDESWLVSPALDFSAGLYSMFFDISYAENTPADDRLRILASTDCGATYSEVILDRLASSFTSEENTTGWVPGSDGDWRREYVSIASLAGLKQVRIAYVVQNDNGNNLYIDNIEFFAGDDTHPPTTTAPYQLYYSSQTIDSSVALTFNLKEKQDVQLQIFSMQGNIVADMILPETLNQTYYYDLSTQASGLYLFRLLIDNQPSVTKVFIGH
ncbi:MAG: choice-of-anchor J domain-containing protein [Cyclobacteriaceae bacterium]|nr:choice-of-anchor J domain-containing protein [Cyclobacteriaceae bacterium]